VRSLCEIPSAIYSTAQSCSGIGLESSLLFAQEGAHVLLVDINLAAAEKGAALVKERYPEVKALATKADVGKEADIKAAVDLAVKEFGRLDVMVCSDVLPATVRHSRDATSSSTTRVCGDNAHDRPQFIMHRDHAPRRR
jgi:NAD(P)-dependent dehydrogenase (short-subunit alcohol dehydrogenase family)